MKKIIYLLLILALPLGFVACGDDDGPNPHEPIVLTVYSKWMHYNSPNVFNPDKGATVYLFSGKECTLSKGYNYVVGGTVTKVGEPNITFDKKFTIGDDGTVKIPAEEYRNKAVTIAIESAKYPGQYVRYSFPKIDKSITEGMEFNNM